MGSERYMQAKKIGLALWQMTDRGFSEGRDPQQFIEDIRRTGNFFTPNSLRDLFLRGLEVNLGREGAKNVIVTGCAAASFARAVSPFLLLLDRLGIDYYVPRKEYCCGAPLILDAIATERDRDPMDKAAHDFIGLNIEQARKAGAQRMVYLCIWCAYLARRFYPREDIEQLYYPDLLVRAVEKVPLSLNGVSIGYFPGGQHRSWLYAPERDFEFDFPAYRRILSNISGLTVVDIPTKYCCVAAADAIFRSAEHNGTATVVTSCLPCYGTLKATAPTGMQVKSLPQILLEALDKGS